MNMKKAVAVIHKFCEHRVDSVLKKCGYLSCPHNQQSIHEQSTFHCG